MTARHSPNTPVTTYQNQAQLYYHWLTFCNSFIEVDTNGGNWGAVKAGTGGSVSSTASSIFTTPGTNTFEAIHVGMYLAIRDTNNPVNTVIAEIVSRTPTQATLNSPVISFTVSSTDLDYVIIDPSILPASGHFFVIQNPVASQPAWQARFDVMPAENRVGVTFAPTGGWNSLSQTWTLPRCNDTVVMHNTLVTSFMVADPDQGWVFLWTEESAPGFTSNRCGVWLGSLSPLHAPHILGTPSDPSYAVIFGSTVNTADNLNRNTGSVSSISSGQAIHSDSSQVAIYFGQKRLIGSGTDVNTIAAAATNARSTLVDDYDIVAFQRAAGKQIIRGKVSGLRLMNEATDNRVVFSDGATYSLGNGLGVVWNDKDSVP